MTIKFIDAQQVRVYYCSTANDVHYRCDDTGVNWERLYGESWETVVNYNEQEECRSAWLYYFDLDVP